MSTTKACDFCGGALGESLYTPRGTRRNIGVFVCQTCGLLQSVSLAPFEPSREVSLSCDADWGNVRHGKGARFASLLPMLRSLSWNRISRIVDVGSSRGDFVQWVASEHPGKEIYAIEPDASVTGSYDERPAITTMHEKFADVSLPPCDLIYLVHTLEHADSMKAMLGGSLDVLSDDGVMVLEVPNVAAMDDPNVVEEFFIDKHTFHCEPDSLIEYLQHGCGLDAFYTRVDRLNITMLLRHGYSEMAPLPPIVAPDYGAQIASYDARLMANRSLLSEMVNKHLRPLAQRQRVAYWGAGRIFDALVRYGGLQASDVHALVDGHLAGIVKEANGVEIAQPGLLKYIEPQVVVVLARGSAGAIKDSAHAMGFRWVVTFDELMDQVRR